jgi:hypothetical protein
MVNTYIDKNWMSQKPRVIEFTNGQTFLKVTGAATRLDLNSISEMLPGHTNCIRTNLNNLVDIVSFHTFLIRFCSSC